MHPQVTVFPDAEQVATAVAHEFLRLAQQAIGETGSFSVALAGGSTPKRVYELLATDTFRQHIEWDKVHIFFGDERTVPADSTDSNFRMAREALLSHVPVPEPNIHMIDGVGDAVSNASLYESELREYFGEDATLPRFDLILLGMGDDGHTASLFPHTAALQEATAWVTSNWVEKLNTFRITLTYPAINNAVNVIFTVTGDGKAARLAEVLNGDIDSERLPSQKIQPTDGTVRWFVDSGAAAKLEQAPTEGAPGQHVSVEAAK